MHTVNVAASIRVCINLSAHRAHTNKTLPNDHEQNLIKTPHELFSQMQIWYQKAQSIPALHNLFWQWNTRTYAHVEVESIA